MAHNWFGDDVASGYDEDVAEMFDATELTATVDVLAELAGDGAALEFAIGTGRVAIPLSQRGVAVSGVELSTAMLDQLRLKPGGHESTIPVAVGDMATTVVAGAGSFSLVYLVFNTITNLTSQPSQVQCFRNAAHHLASGGFFVVETFVPRLRHLPPGQRLVPFAMTDSFIGIDEYDVVDQQLTSHYVERHDGSVHRSAMPFRYVWPSELDLMAELASLTLTFRWADWSKSPFTDDSDRHVSVWRKP